MASNGYHAGSLSASVTSSNDASDTALADFIGFEEDAYDLIDNFRSLTPLIAGLDERERTLMHLRFVEEQTQTQIGEALGVSQMHASRLITRP